MRVIRRGILVLTAALMAGGLVAGCRRAVVIVPQRDRGYTQTDTLYGLYKDKRVRITFRHDTTWRVDTVLRRDTLWRAGSRVDTVLFTRVDTLVRRDSSRFFARRDTIVRRDTLRLIVRDTLRVTRVDTLRLVTRDTVVRRDTVRLAGQRMLFVPPGQYPPAGQCRIWIHDRPPGQQERAAPCTALGPIPAGAFVLFGGEAWDLDYDWIAAGTRGGAPPEIVALKRR